MFQKCGFADAFSSLEDADFVVIGLPFDSTASFRAGSRDGPDAVRLASYNFESYNCRHNVDLADLNICDLGNLELGSDPLYAIEAIKDGLSTLPEGTIPIALGGEHSIAPPIAEHMAKQGGLGVLVMDAHLDLRSEYGCTIFSHACTSKRLLGIEGIQGYSSSGIRSGSKDEFDYALENCVRYHKIDEIVQRGIGAVLEDVLLDLNSERLYLSIDMDVVDPAFAPAVGNPEPCGMTPCDIRHVIDKLASRIVALDITEITPAYDKGQTAILGAWLAREFIAARAEHL